jgi:hypothetical protein
MILDHQLNIVLDTDNPPIANYHALWHARAGLYFAASSVRRKENHLYMPPGVRKFVFMGGDFGENSLIACFFDWFSISTLNYLRLVALFGFLNENGYKSDALRDQTIRKKINPHCKSYVEGIVPELLKWRNKVAAHHSITDPYNEDTLATLESSIFHNLALFDNNFVVGRVKMYVGADASELPEWAITEVYERLTPRFWPEDPLDPHGLLVEAAS